MNPKEFYDKVVLMRKLQKEYFRSRSRSALDRSKAVEREIDSEIERVSKITGESANGGKEPKEQNLFASDA